MQVVSAELKFFFCVTYRVRKINNLHYQTGMKLRSEAEVENFTLEIYFFGRIHFSHKSLFN